MTGVHGAFTPVLGPLKPVYGRNTCRDRAKEGGGPQGTFYIVKRLLPGERDYTIMGTTTSKRFTDETLRVGVGEAWYAIDAQHGKHLVRGDILIVQLGSVREALGAGAAAKTSGKAAA